MTVNTETHCRHVVVQGWDRVAEVVTALAGGSSAGLAQTTAEVGERSGGLGAAIFGLGASVLAGDPAKFARRFVEEAQRATAGRTRSFEGSYDYEGPGAFFKSVGTLIVLDRETERYAVGVWNRSGERQERQFIERFRLPTCLMRATVTVEAEPETDTTFALDFAPVAEALGRGAGIAATGEEIVSALMSGGRDDEPVFVRPADHGLRVTVSPARVVTRFHYSAGEASETWRAEGSVLRGRLREDFRDGREGRNRPPEIAIVVTSAAPLQYGEQEPVWQPERQQAARDYAAAIALALR